MKKIMEGLGKLWFQLFGKRDWVVTDRIIKGTELALEDIQAKRQKIFDFNEKIKITHNDIQKLKLNGENKLKEYV